MSKLHNNNTANKKKTSGHPAYLKRPTLNNKNINYLI